MSVTVTQYPNILLYCGNTPTPIPWIVFLYMHHSIPNTLALQVKNIHKRAIEIAREILSKNKRTSLWNSVPNSCLRKFCFAISIFETCYRVSSKKVGAQSVISWTVVGQLSWQYTSEFRRYETTTTPVLSTPPTYALILWPTSQCILRINSLTRFMPTLFTSGFAWQRSHSQTRFPRKFPAMASLTYKKIPTARKSWSLA